MAKVSLARFKLETKYVLFLVLVFLVLLVIVIGAGSYVLLRIEKSLHSLNAGNLDRVVDILDGQISGIDVYGESFLTNEMYQEELSSITDTDDKVEISKLRRLLTQQLASRHGDNSYITAISITFPDNEQIYTGEAVPSEITEKAEPLAEAASGRPVWISAEEGIFYYARDIRRIKFLKLDHLAYLYFKVDFGKMIQDLRQYNDSVSETLIAVFDDSRLLFSSLELSEDDLEELSLMEEDFKLSRIGKKTYLVSKGELNGGSWHCLSFLDNTELSRSLFTSFVLLLSGLALLLLLSLGLIHLISKSMLKHFWVLKDKMEAFSSGQALTAFPCYTERTDEIGILHQEFDKMVLRFDDLIKDNYLKQILIKDSQLQILSQHVNPHSLTAIFNSIYWSAMGDGAEEAARMTYALSQLFRLTAKTDSILASLQEEMEYVDCYLEIQQLRFTDRISIHKDIATDCLEAQIPRLSLQLLVENAMHYAVQKQDVPCIISIQAASKDGSVRIRFSNTGSSFPEDVWARAEKKNKESRLLSLRNRLQLVYGDRASMEVKNEGIEAVVIIAVPKQGEINVQGLAGQL